MGAFAIFGRWTRLKSGGCRAGSGSIVIPRVLSSDLGSPWAVFTHGARSICRWLSRGTTMGITRAGTPPSTMTLLQRAAAGSPLGRIKGVPQGGGRGRRRPIGGKAMDRSRHAPFCLIVRGPLGVGKTTVSRSLGRAESAGVVSIDRVLEENSLEEWDTDRVALRSFLRANAFAVDQTHRNLRARRSTIVEGNFYWIEALEDLVGRLRCPSYVVHLVAPLEVCIARDAGRPEPSVEVGPKPGDRLGEGSVRAVFGFVRPVPIETKVDASGNVGETVARVQNALHAWRSTRRAGMVRSPP